MVEYTCGFMFSPDYRRVLLIKKKNPEWQRGFLNGIGGKLEPPESIKDCMIREFKEETGLTTVDKDWEFLWSLTDHANFTVYFFKAVGPIDDAYQATEEAVYIKHVGFLGNYILPQAGWMIPLALEKYIDQPLVFTHVETRQNG